MIFKKVTARRNPKKCYCLYLHKLLFENLVLTTRDSIQKSASTISYSIRYLMTWKNFSEIIVGHFSKIFCITNTFDETRTIKKAEHGRTYAFELWCWRRLLRFPWTSRRSKQSILKETNPEYLYEALILKLKLQYFGHLM